MQSERKNIKSEELETSEKTGEDIFSLNKKDEPTHTYTEKDSDNETIIGKERGDSGVAPTPAEISRKKYYNSEKRKNDAKTAFFNVLKWLVPIFVSIIVGLLAFFGAVWAYKLNNIAEPIGGIKVEIDNLKKDRDKNELNIEKLEDRLNGFLERNMK